MEKILPIEPNKSLDGYHDFLTHHYSAPVFYDALKREISFAKREGQIVTVAKFKLIEGTSLDQMLYFANELEINVRRHDLIARISEHDFAVLLRFDFDSTSACECLLNRLKNVEKREFFYTWVSTDGTKGLEEILSKLDNPQNLRSSKRD